jgi:hypothetical protein
VSTRCVRAGEACAPAHTLKSRYRIGRKCLVELAPRILSFENTVRRYVVMGVWLGVGIVGLRPSNGVEAKKSTPNSLEKY